MDFRGSRQALSVKSSKPLTASSTNCQGRTAPGLRNTSGRPAWNGRIASGTSRSAAQSPPPTILPARIVASAGSDGHASPTVAERMAANSALALLNAYGSHAAEGIVLLESVASSGPRRKPYQS